MAKPRRLKTEITRAQESTSEGKDVGTGVRAAGAWLVGLREVASHVGEFTIKKRTVESRDVAEIIVGSLVLVFPLALTEEIWNLSEEISLARVLII
jgi:uncharacterized membrane protein